MCGYLRALRAMMTIGVCLALVQRSRRPLRPTAELDTFMAQVLTRRDENWKKVQHHPRRARTCRAARARRGAAVGDQARVHVVSPRWVFRPEPGPFQRRRDQRGRAGTVRTGLSETNENRDERAKEQGKETEGTADVAPSDLQGLLQQTREPQFVSSAYLLKFKFEEGRYALVGRETIENLSVLRIEYYPTRLFSDDPDTRAEARAKQVAGPSPATTPTARKCRG